MFSHHMMAKDLLLNQIANFHCDKIAVKPKEHRDRSVRHLIKLKRGFSNALCMLLSLLPTFSVGAQFAKFCKWRRF